MTDRGGVQCWGLNYHGQLGTGTTVDSRVAVDVAGLSSGVLAVTAGGSHSCALLSDGLVKCWGDNAAGQLGSPTPYASYHPVDVVGLSGAIAISAGGGHTCALTNAGAVKCWGNNYWGQLGNGGIGSGATVVDVTGLGSGVVAIDAGYLHTCAVTAVAVKCWGANHSGQLGDGSTAQASTPADVLGLGAGVITVGAGDAHSCAVLGGGGAKCWGSNGAGQLGTGTSTHHLTPIDVSGLTSGVVGLAAGAFHTCALVDGGNVKCWGYNADGELGNGTTATSLLPLDVVGLAGGAASIASSGNHSCALIAGGVQCWGTNLYGQLGNAVPSNFTTPVDVVELAGVVDIANGEDHSCALTAAGAIKCWGRNVRGAIGDGTVVDAFAPVDVPYDQAFAAVRAGGYATCAITVTGGVTCWGELGSTSPADVQGLASGVVDLAVGSGHACALTSAGAVKCWGANAYGQLGDGTTTDSATPVDVVGLASNVAAVGIGRFHSCAVMSDGSVRCWGDNYSGQLGLPRGGLSSTPVPVAGLNDARKLDAGAEHTCVTTNALTIKCWGSNDYAQFGVGHVYPVPGIVTAPLGPVSIQVAAGAYHNCQLGSTGLMHCWGNNEHGQVGNGATAPYWMPVRLPTHVTAITQATRIAAGGRHSCALAAGAAKCWGQNYHGQLGNGVGGYALTPQTVRAGLCGGFSDVVAGNPFCANVEWSQNRSVAMGCASGLFCGEAATARLALAGFFERIATALTPKVLVAQEIPGPLNPAAPIVVCATADFPTGAQPRRAYLDGVLSALAGADTGVAIHLVYSFDRGLSWFSPLLFDFQHTVARAGQWANLRDLAHVDLGQNGTVRFGIEVSRGALPQAGTFVDSTCNLRVRIDNFNYPAPP